MDKMREEFEAAWREIRPDGYYNDSSVQNDIDSFYPERNKYGHSDIQEAWIFWQASRKALVVELPQPNNDGEDSLMRRVEIALDKAGVSY